jgi:hypothetical protein
VDAASRKKRCGCSSIAYVRREASGRAAALRAEREEGARRFGVFGAAPLDPLYRLRVGANLFKEARWY